MPVRRRVKLRQLEAVLLPDIHHYLLLMTGEVLKLDGHSRFLRLAIKCGSTVLSRTASPSGDPCRVVVPIANLAIGHAHYLRRHMGPAIEHLQLARNQFHTLPDSPLKQFYLGRCVCLLIQSHAYMGRLDREVDVSSDAIGLLRGLMNLVIDQSPDKRNFVERADNVLLKLTHPPSIWYERCLYDIVEITTAHLHIHRSSSPDPHYARLVALLMGMPAKGAPDIYHIEREFALSLTFHSKMDEALALWRRLLHWKNSMRDDQEEEEDTIRFRIITCLVTLGRPRDAKVELSKVDLAHSLVHFSHGPGLLYLARRTYYQIGEFGKLLELCRGYQNLCDQKFKPNDIVPLMNRYYSARILKRLGRYGEAVKRYRNFVSVVEKTTELMSGNSFAFEIDSTRTLQGLLGEGRRGLAHALRLTGRIDECIFQYRKALQFARTDYFSDFKLVRAVLKSLAYLYESTGDTKNAIVAYDLLHRHYLRKPAHDQLAVIKYSWYRGKMFLLMGQLEHALALFRHAHFTCASKRMESAKTRWPTPAELELARRTIETEDEEQEAAPGEMEDGPMPVQEHEQNRGQEAEQSTKQALGGDGTSRGAELPAENVAPGAPQEPAHEDLDVEDRSPFGSQESVPKMAVGDNDRWWARTIEASIEVAERGGCVEDPVPLDHYDSDPDEIAPDTDEPTLASEPFVMPPIGKRLGEMTEPKFEELPETYKEYKEAKLERERYPWRRGVYEDEAKGYLENEAPSTGATVSQPIRSFEIDLSWI
ncbi:uncharacterized protein DNG_05624 [Cephalotrichum gorgonifer]|uniref:Uncharacterized protein n=1 Tax=Cephalotrichum gorgonifer TaxID=2041049 RepID=A0AAE8MYJ5_9PEZI|nr:uncharacterized protein DNG_05624 [Cephalotrichum gorgonifer]